MTGPSDGASAAPLTWEDAAPRKTAPAIRKLALADLTRCLAQGLADFRRAPSFGLFFGGIYAIGGWLIVWFAWVLQYPYLSYPLAMGFALIAPFVCAGTYEVSRGLERGEALTWAGVLGAVWGRAGKDLGWLALVSAFTLIVWVDFAWFLFLMFYGLHIPAIGELLTAVFTSSYGLLFAFVGNACGAAIAFAVFSITVVSPPLLVDRDIDFVTAMTTSVRLVVANPMVMLVWAATIGVLVALSAATALVGLFVVLPVLGHASWALYRRAVEAPPGPQPTSAGWRERSRDLMGRVEL